VTLTVPNNVSSIVARRKAIHVADVLLEGRLSALMHAKYRHLLSYFKLGERVIEHLISVAETA